MVFFQMLLRLSLQYAGRGSSGLCINSGGQFTALDNAGYVGSIIHSLEVFWDSFKHELQSVTSTMWFAITSGTGESPLAGSLSQDPVLQTYHGHQDPVLQTDHVQNQTWLKPDKQQLLSCCFLSTVSRLPLGSHTESSEVTEVGVDSQTGSLKRWLIESLLPMSVPSGKPYRVQRGD
jgi:hypothetical protein